MDYILLLETEAAEVHPSSPRGERVVRGMMPKSNTLVDSDKPNQYFADHLRTFNPSPYKRSQNKYIASHIRNGISQTFDHLGGWAGLAAWAKDNPDLFYSRVLPMVLPKAQVEGITGGVTVIINRGGVDSNDKPSVIDMPAQLMDTNGQDVNRSGQ